MADTVQASSEKTTWDVLARECEAIQHGTWKIELVIYNGRCVGFDQLEPAKKSYRLNKSKDK